MQPIRSATTVVDRFNRLAVVFLTLFTWVSTAVAYDFGNDGKPDILWRNRTSGEDRIWLMNGLNVSSEANIPSLTADGWRMIAAADFNGDGKDVGAHENGPTCAHEKRTFRWKRLSLSKQVFRRLNRMQVPQAQAGQRRMLGKCAHLH